MCHHAYRSRTDSVGENAALLEMGAERSAVEARTDDVHNDDVRLRWIRPNARNLGETFGESLGIGMILLEDGGHSFERDQARCRKNTSLPHSATKALSIQPAFLDVLARTH